MLAHPLGIALAAQLNTLPVGTLDRLLFSASQQCNNCCNRRLQAPQATTVASPGVSAGSSVLPVSSTLGTDNKDEYAVQIGIAGSNQETIDLVAGGVAPALPLVYPYPGTFQLTTPLVHNHLSGEPVQLMYHETRRSMSQSEEDIYEQIVTQQAQVAASHTGGSSDGTGFLNAERTKIHWFWQYPLIRLIDMDHAYPYTNEFTQVDIPSLLIEPAMSRVRFPVGSFILSNGLLRYHYIAGYLNMDDQIKEATIWYLRASLQAFINPYAVVSQSLGKRNYNFGTGPKSPLILQAEELLKEYVR